MFVHVEREDRDGSGNGLAVIGCALVDEPAIPRHVGQQDPARAAGQCGGERDELGSPTIDRAEVPLDRGRDAVGQHPPIATHAGEIQFVQQG